jgi:hypothetical protein
MTLGVAAGLGDAGALRLVSSAGAGVVSAGAGAMAWSPQARPMYGGGGTIVHGGAVTVAPTIQTSTALTDSQKYALVRDIADAQREATAIVYQEQGVQA